MSNKPRRERQEFRVDDMLPLRDLPLTEEEFERKRSQISARARQATVLQEMINRDLFGNEVRDRLNPELSEAMSKLDAKLNFLIGANMMQNANQQEMKERPVNLSCTGAAFVPEHMYTKGMYINVIMMLATFPPTPVDLLGKVMWVRKKKSGEPFIGIKFFFRNRDEEDVMSKYVFKRSREMIRLKRLEEEERKSEQGAS
ncbi:MAG: PilZ domain-containing protein [Zetaproteobacteria bacterium]|nr:MAG: PilZ domain-containing protein [Zetaproteobacteria bacterium]